MLMEENRLEGEVRAKIDGREASAVWTKLQKPTHVDRRTSSFLFPSLKEAPRDYALRIKLPMPTPETIPVEWLILRAEAAFHDARRLQREDPDEYQQTIFDLIVRLITLIEVAATGKAVPQVVLKGLSDELDYITQGLTGALRRQIHGTYVWGVVFGTIVTTLLAYTYFALHLSENRLVAVFHPVMNVSILLGGIGGLVSVLERIRQSDIPGLTERHKPNWVFFNGLARPVVGAIFAFVLWAGTKGGLIPLRVPETVDLELYFFAFLAFGAGFLERWAPDLVASSLGKAAPPKETENQFAGRGR